MFLRGADVGVIVFSLSEPSSFENLPSWVDFFNDLPSGECSLIIVGNKSDIRPWEVAVADVEHFSETHRLPHILTSVLTRDGIQELLEQIAGIVAGKESTPSQPTGVALSEPPIAEAERKRRC
jgi:GTPase SAR1 family protein